MTIQIEAKVKDKKKKTDKNKFIGFLFHNKEVINYLLF